MTLALQYRPSRFSEVAGQKATVAVLHAMARRKTLPPAMLFYGPRGSGKTTSARILGAALNCANPGSAAVWPCGDCASCTAVAAGTSLDVIEVDAASNGTVEKIREIRELVLYGTAGEWRVVLLDEAHSMSRDAFNALLKVLEEPPPLTVFILLTTEQGKILPTVASRCVPFSFTRLPPAVICDRLAQVCDAENLAVSDDLLKHIAERADGAMRDALMLLDQAASVGITTLGAWQQLAGEEDYGPSLVQAAVSGDHAALFAELDRVLMRTADFSAITGRLVRCLRDILVLSGGGEVAAQGDALEARRELARQLEARRVVRAMSVLWDLQVKVRAEDRRAALELAVVMVAEKLCPAPREAAAAGGNGNGHKPATEADIMSMEGFVPA